MSVDHPHLGTNSASPVPPIPRSLIPRNAALSVDSITIKIGADIGDSLVGLEAIRAKLVEIEAQAERTAAALAKVKI